MMQTGRILCALGALCVAAWAQPATGVAGPVTGFIFSPTPAGSIRPMLGIPGAAYLGGAAATGLEAASIAPDGSAALAVRQDGQLILYSGLRSAPVPTALVVAGGVAGVDHFAWAPDSGSAAVYSSASGQYQIVSNLATAPAAGSPVTLALPSGAITTIAFDGQRVILAVASATSGGIYVATPGNLQRIASAPSPSAMALFGTSLFFADSLSQQVSEVENYAATPATVLFSGDENINSPAGLQGSADGKRLFVANAGNQKLVVYDIASRTAIQTIALSFAPTRLDRFGDASVFVLNEGGTGPFYVVRDASPGKASVYFVPSPDRAHPVKAPIRPA